jgi:TonB family protein
LQKAGYEQNGIIKLVRTSEYVSSFSFFSFVFVNPSVASNEMEEIMNHEREHIQQRHWFDLLLVELICIVQWFNPFAWIYAHLVRQNHEFLADESALQCSADPAVYQAALLNQLLGVPVFSLTNSFSYSLNKKRFKMMKKKIDSPFRKLKMLVILPLVAMLFYAFSAPVYQYNTDKPVAAVDGKTINVKGTVVKSDGAPLPGTTVILRGSTTGTITDANGDFQLKEVPANGELVFSFVGFQSVVQKVNDQPMKITMEIESVGIDKIVVVGYKTRLTPPPPALQELFNDNDPSKQPLILLDNVVIDKKTWDNVDKTTIGAQTIKKSDAFVEKYGDKAKNGVLVVFTKAKIDSLRNAAKKNFAPSKRADGVYVVVEEMPEFPGGEVALRKYILDAIKYPADAKKKGLEGKVFVTFVVNDEGKVENAKIARGLSPSLDKEALRVVSKLPAWKPGKQGGKAVKVSYTAPVLFTLTGDKKPVAAQEPLPDKDQKGVFVVVEQMPEFPGGILALRRFLAMGIVYPAEAQKDTIQGNVFVSFVINTQGKVENVKVVKGVHRSLDAEALRVVSTMPDWKPAKQHGVAVNVAYTIPIEFALK